MDSCNAPATAVYQQKSKIAAREPLMRWYGGRGKYTPGQDARDGRQRDTRTPTQSTHMDMHNNPVRTHATGQTDNPQSNDILSRRKHHLLQGR